MTFLPSKLKNAESVFAFRVGGSAGQRAYDLCSIVLVEEVSLSNEEAAEGRGFQRVNYHQ
jgi:hypothetical protein